MVSNMTFQMLSRGPLPRKLFTWGREGGRASIWQPDPTTSARTGPRTRCFETFRGHFLVSGLEGRICDVEGLALLRHCPLDQSRDGYLLLYYLGKAIMERNEAGMGSKEKDTKGVNEAVGKAIGPRRAIHIGPRDCWQSPLSCAADDSPSKPPTHLQPFSCARTKLSFLQLRDVSSRSAEKLYAS